MSYCVNCGVELAPSEKRCPLCDTEVINPRENGDKNVRMPFPEKENNTDKVVTRYGIWLLLTVLFLVPASVTLICDISINSHIEWSDIVSISLGVIYVMLTLPIVFMNKNPMFYITADFFAVFILLYYICEKYKGNWALSFATPVLLLLLLYIAVMTVTSRSGRVPKLSRIAIALYLAAVFSVLLEGLIILYFEFQKQFIWSYYPFVVFVLFGSALLVVEKNKPLKEKIRRKFFI